MENPFQPKLTEEQRSQGLCVLNAEDLMEEENEPQGEGVWLENVVDSTLEHKSRGNQTAAAVTDWALFCWRSKSKTPGPFRFGYIYLCPLTAASGSVFRQTLLSSVSRMSGLISVILLQY